MWISYFEDGDTVPAPFNLFPSVKNVKRMVGLEKSKRTSGSMIVTLKSRYKNHMKKKNLRTVFFFF